MHNRKLPENAILERAIISALLNDSLEKYGTATLIFDKLSANDFYIKKFKMIFTAAYEIYLDGKKVDVVEVFSKLTKINKADECGGIYFLTQLSNEYISKENLEEKCQELLGLSRRRKAIKLFMKGADDLFNMLNNHEEILAQINMSTYELFEMNHNKGFIGIDDIAIQAADRAIQRRNGRNKYGILSGFKDLDSYTGGFENGNSIILAARTSQGKSSLAINIATNVAKSGYGVGIFTLEDSKISLANRLIAAEGNLNSIDLRTGQLSEREINVVKKTVDEIKSLPLYINDMSGIDSNTLRIQAKCLYEQRKVKMFIIDYVQLMHSRKRVESRQLEISAISADIKALAKELDVPIITLAQLSREVENRKTKIPQLSDLRESGSLEQDPDVVLLIRRPSYYGLPKVGDEVKLTDEQFKALTYVYVAKQREGPTGKFRLWFDETRNKFKDWPDIYHDDIYDYKKVAAGDEETLF